MVLHVLMISNGMPAAPKAHTVDAALLIDLHQHQLDCCSHTTHETWFQVLLHVRHRIWNDLI